VSDKTYYEEAHAEVSEEIERRILMSKIEMQGSRRAIKYKEPQPIYPIAGRVTWERHLQVEKLKKQMWERALNAIDEE